MEELTRSRILRLLSEAKDRVCNVCYEPLPTKLHNRAETIEYKLLGLFEDIRDLTPK